MASNIAWPQFSTGDTPLDVLVKLSRFYGADPDFVLAGGGNTSVKVGDRLFVKGSGHALASIGPEGFVEMDRPALDALAGRDLGPDRNRREELFKQAVMAARVHPELNQRPSVEVLFHHLVPGQFVIHTHATLVNMLACCRQGESLVRQLFGDQVLWIPETDPGIPLAQVIRDALREHARKAGRPRPRAIIMQNHGLIVAGDTPEEIRQHTDWVIGALARHMAALPPSEPFGPVTSLDDAARRQLLRTIAPALRGLLAGDEGLKIITFDDTPEALSLAGSTEGRAIAAGGPLMPDQIVYCRALPLWFQPAAGEEAGAMVDRLRAAIADHARQTNFPPNVVLVQGVGLFAAGDDFAGADTVRVVYLDAIKVMAGARRLGQINYLSDSQREFFEYWEVEAYRRKVARGSIRAGRASGKVALVTGAAQGFGLEIAQDLAAQGAHVILADVNVEGARQSAARIAAQLGAGRAIGLGMNVTEGQSVQAALDQVLRQYGGLDVLVSNAGVLRAASVKTQPEKDFDFVTAVNYKGYFVVVQRVAPIMAIQRRACSRAWSDIIQINSKSGLTGSNRNGAYAGSKFGGIGLTQSFALELIEDGIKVNAVCPGNFFDGPLWSDPDNGLFVQYLRSGKVPGARTIEDVRKAYESKIPMGRGCATADVMKAIYYLIEQQYETGQAVPVTGGQVMLS